VNLFRVSVFISRWPLHATILSRVKTINRSDLYCTRVWVWSGIRQPLLPAAGSQYTAIKLPIESAASCPVSAVSERISAAKKALCIGIRPSLWNSKIQKCYWFWQHPQQTVDVLADTEHLTYFTVSTADIDKLTFWSLSDVSNQQFNVVQLNVHGDFFYRAMHMHKRGLCCHPVSVCMPVCLSVCLSRLWITSKRIKISLKFFTILVFPSQRGCRYSDGNPPNGGFECKGVWQNNDFFTNISLYLRNGNS